MSQRAIHIKKLVLIALLGASLNAFKLALMYLPNIEVVTLLITLYTYVFGASVGFFSAMVFCVLEGFIWGFNPTWLFAYFIHWGFISVVAMLLRTLKIKNSLVVATIIALVTALFGVQSTFMYFLAGSGLKVGWQQRFVKMYIAGTAFYITHIVSNFIIVLLLFKPVYILLNKLKQGFFYGK